MPASSPLSILIVDDDARTMRRLAQLLRDDGFVVHTAEDVRSARALAASVPFGVALVDVRLPDGDGRLLADAWLAEYPALRVIYVTIYPELFRAAGAGARHFSMTKPVDYARLVGRLRAIEAGVTEIAGE